MFEGWRKWVREYVTEGLEHVVKCLSHDFRVKNNYEFGLNSGLDKGVEPGVFDFSVKELEFVLDFGFAEDELNFFGLFSDVGIEKLFECELFFFEVEVGIVFEDLADLFPMGLGEFIVETLEEGDVGKIFLYFLDEELEDLIVGFVVDGFYVYEDSAFLGDEVFECF